MPAALIVIAAAVFLYAGGALFAAGARSIVDEWTFARRGVSTDATILTKEITRSTGGFGSSYEATYQFSVPEGIFESRARLAYGTWSRLKEREAAEVLYLPDRPGSSRLIGGHQRMLPSFLALVGGSCMAVGGTLAIHALRRAQRTQGPL